MKFPQINTIRKLENMTKEEIYIELIDLREQLENDQFLDYDDCIKVFELIIKIESLLPTGILTDPEPPKEIPLFAGTMDKLNDLKII